MKKIRYIAGVLCLLWTLVIPVTAAEETNVIVKNRLLTSADQEALQKYIDVMKEQYQIDIVMAIQQEYSSETAWEEARDLYEEGGYGVNDTKDGMVLFVNKTEKEWAVYTNGKADDLFDDEEIEELGEAAVTYVANHNQAKGFRVFIDEIDQRLGGKAAAAPGEKEWETLGESMIGEELFGKASKEQEAKAMAKYQRSVKKENDSQNVTAAIVCGLIITLIRMIPRLKELKAVDRKQEAGQYLRNTPNTQLFQKEIYLTSEIIRKRK